MLCDLLSSLVPNDNSCKDTFSFVSQIKNANLSGKFPLSYDATSLFINISLQEKIDIGIYFIFNHNPNLNITKNNFFNQFNGLAMASPLAPVLTDIFMVFMDLKA